jgi:hypothetical protein
MDLTRLKELFSEALEQSPELRAAFLDQVCAHDGKLRARIEQMLRVYDGASGFMGDPTAEYIELQKAHETAAVPTVRGKIRAISHPPSEQVGAHVGPYKLLEQIGEGGFGVV